MANKLKKIIEQYNAKSQVSSEQAENIKAALALEKLHTPPVQPPAFLTETVNPDTTSHNLLNNLNDVDPSYHIDPVTGRLGDTYGVPDAPSPEWLEYLRMQEAEDAMRDAGIMQDPNLEGTGQPGELYMVPGSPEWEEKFGPYERPEEDDVGAWMKDQGKVKDADGIWQDDPDYAYRQQVKDEEKTKGMSPLDLINMDAKKAASWDVAGITRNPGEPKFSMVDILDDVGLIFDMEVT
tara:strand:+ start:5930 stop:6640 length:711 start_codon:yes stop_codon:yes gene_type:complete